MKNYLTFVLSLFILTNCLGQKKNSITQNSDIVSEGCTSTADNTKGIRVGDYLYVGFWALDSRIETYDLSTPTSPTLVNQFNMGPGTGGSIIDMEYGNGYIYATGRYNDRFFVIDISNPAAPSLAGQTAEIFNIGGEMVVNGNYVYVLNLDNKSLDVIDVSDPTTPTRIGQYNSLLYLHGIEYKDGYVYLIGDDIQVIDVSTPTAPSWSSTISTPSYNLYGVINGDFLYASISGSGTINKYDISTASSPVHDSDIIIPNTSHISDFKTDAKYLYAACHTSSALGAVSVVDISSGASPLPIYQSPTSSSSPSGIAPADGYIYTIGYTSGSESVCTYSVPQSCGNFESLTPASSEICAGSYTTINTGSSETDANYYLRNAATDEIISGPVAGTGSTISLNTGIISNTTEFKVSIAKEYALNFNGTTEHVTVPHNSAFEFSTGTVECWIKPTAYSVNKSFISMRTNGATSRFSLHLNEGANTLGLYSNSTGYNTIPYSTNPNTWYHIAMVMKSSNTDVYVNGAYAGTINGTIDGSKTGYPFVIGSPNDVNYTNENFVGDMDEVRVWNTERTATEIADNYNTCLTGSETGLVAFYSIGGGEGSTVVTDLSSNGFDGVLTNMDANTDWVSGKAVCNDCSYDNNSTTTVTTVAPLNEQNYRGNMLTFDGVSNYVNIPMNSELQFGTGEFAMEVWINTTSSANEVVVGSDGGSFNYSLGTVGGKASFNINGVSSNSSTSVNDGDWHHIVGVRVGGNIQIFVDGVLENIVANATNASPTSDLAIGKMGGGSSFFNGSVDEVRIWKVARTQTEIRANKHISMYGGCESDLVGYFKFNEASGSTAEDLSLVNNDGTHMSSPTITSSEVQVAGGIATVHMINSAGNNYTSLSSVTDHTLDLQFSSVHPNGEVVVTFLDELPQGGAPASAHGNYRNESWIIDNYGATTTGLDGITTFNYPDGHVSDMTLTNYKLHKRPSNSTGVWTENNATASAVGTTSGNNFISYDGISSFSIFFPSASASALPIELIYFDAKLNDETVTLNWGTASERDNDFFTIEKSKDGITWEEVIRVAGAGQSSTVLNYKAKDEQPYEGVSYYRLKQTDSDGRTSYSENRTVNLISIDEAPIVFPNPSKGVFSVKLNPDYIGGMIEIKNFYGGDILRKTIESDLEEINLEDFSNGVYLIFISNKNFKYSDRIVISK